MGISLAQLYASKKSGVTVSTSPPRTVTELDSTFVFPVVSLSSTATVTSSQYFVVGQYVFISDGTNYGSFKIIAINGNNLNLLNYGGKIVGTAVGSGGQVVQSGKDGDDAVPADVVGMDALAIIINGLRSQIELLIDDQIAAVSQESRTVAEFVFPEIVGETVVVSVANSAIATIGDWILIQNGTDYIQAIATARGVGTITLTRQEDGLIEGVEPITFPTGSSVEVMRRAISVESDPSKMAIDIYDPDNNGIVDLAAGIDGVAGSGNLKYYGTDETGAAGIYDLPTPPEPAFADITGLARDNGDLDAELTAIDTALSGKFNTPTGTISQYVRGDGSLSTFPTIPTTSKSFGSYFSASPANSTIPLFTATVATTINEIRGLKTTSGTCTVSIQVDGVNVTGLSGLSVTSTEQNPTASGANSVAIGQDVTLVIASTASAVGLRFTLGATLALT